MSDVNDAWDETITILRNEGYSMGWIVASREIFELGWRAHEFALAKNEKSHHLSSSEVNG